MVKSEAGRTCLTRGITRKIGGAEATKLIQEMWKYHEANQSM